MIYPVSSPAQFGMYISYIGVGVLLSHSYFPLELRRQGAAPDWDILSGGPNSSVLPAPAQTVPQGLRLYLNTKVNMIPP